MLLSFLFAVALLPVTPQDAERVREIAGWLDEAPSPAGLRLDDRDFWRRVAQTKNAKKILAEAKKALKDPVPECTDDLYLECSRTGNRTNYQKPYHARVGKLQKLLLAECIENKGRFLPQIAAYIGAMAGERCWTMPAHDLKLTNFNGTQLTIDLGSSHRAENLAWTIALLRDKLPPETVEKVKAEIFRRVLSVYLAKAADPSKGGNSWFFGRNNWNPVCHAAVLAAALAIVEDRTERAKFIEGEERGVENYLRGFADDGYCTEGIGYWNYGFGSHLKGALLARWATKGKVDFLKNPKHLKIMSYALGYRLTPAVAPQFADGGGFPSSSLVALGALVWPQFASQATERSKGAEVKLFTLPFIFDAPKLDASTLPEKTPLAMRDWFPSAQVLLARSRSGGRFAIAVKGGSNGELHNHNDVGTYMITFDGKRLSGDPGGETYTRWTFSKRRYESKVLNSYGHPVPVVNGQLQHAGETYRAQVISTSFSDDCDEIILELKDAYEVKGLKSLRRLVKLDRVKDEITIRDTATFEDKGTISVPVIFRKGDENSAVKVTQTCSVAAAEENGTIANPGKPDVIRRALTAKAPCAVQTVTTVFAAPTPIHL